jgi:predicted MFS family arabinose efflux permease
MTYWGEFRINWRYVTAAAIGQAAGYYLLSYVSNVFTPHLIAEFGWARSDVALVGSVAFAAILSNPVAGRLGDAIGVKRMAMIGVVSTPLVLLGLSVMNGALWLFFALSFLNLVVLGGTTTAPVYSRLIAYRFRRARGAALAIAASAPAVIAAAFVPLLSELVDIHGWRKGYVALAVYTAIAGTMAIVLIPAGADRRRGDGNASRDAPRDYGAIFRDPAFRLIVVGFVLCNLAVTLQTTQLKVVLLDRGLDSATGSLAISLYAFGVLVGRICCGAALDRFPAHAVAAIFLGLPGAGLLILATGTSAPIPLAAAVLCLGLSFGAEGDLLAYVVMRFFRLEVYSTVLGLMSGALALSVASGSLLLGFMLKLSGSFVPFMTLSGTAALFGAGMFWLLRRVRVKG